MVFARSKTLTTLGSALDALSERSLKVRELLVLLEDDFQKLLGFPTEEPSGLTVGGRVPIIRSYG
jgi:hypothetical protein